jgi:hypothetical protein
MLRIISARGLNTENGSGSWAGLRRAVFFEVAEEREGRLDNI